VSVSPENLRRMIAEDEFGLLDVPVKTKALGPGERLIANFNEIMEFVGTHGREPAINATDMSETKLAMRLRAITGSEEQRLTLLEFDQFDLLKEPEPPATLADAVASDTSGLLDSSAVDIFAIRNVPKVVTTPEKIARRKPCEHFETFEPLFKQCHSEIRAGMRQIIPFRKEQQIRPDTYYVLKGVLVYVADSSAKVKEHGRINARLRCIFENGTETDMLLRSLSSQLYRFGKRVTDSSTAMLASMDLAPETPMATIYVLRSLSDNPQVRDHPHMHKIGSTKQRVGARIAGAQRQTTFLNAPVEVVAEYDVPSGIEQKIEHLLHRLFSDVRLDVWFEQHGATVAEANEWFAVPLKVIDEAIGLIETEAIKDYVYDADLQALKLRS
jgi:hypothetical protein